MTVQNYKKTFFLPKYYQSISQKKQKNLPPDIASEGDNNTNTNNPALFRDTDVY